VVVAATPRASAVWNSAASAPRRLDLVPDTTELPGEVGRRVVRDWCAGFLFGCYHNGEWRRPVTLQDRRYHADATPPPVVMAQADQDLGALLGRGASKSEEQSGHVVGMGEFENGTGDAGTCSLCRDAPISALRRRETLQRGPVDAIGPLSPESSFGVIRDWSERSDPFRWDVDHDLAPIG
jgi:hypothetical protein